MPLFLTLMLLLIGVTPGCARDTFNRFDTFDTLRHFPLRPLITVALLRCHVKLLFLTIMTLGINDAQSYPGYPTFKIVIGGKRGFIG